MVVMDIQSHEEQEETMALLKILALGNQQIEAGEYRRAEEVFAELENDCRRDMKWLLLGTLLRAKE